MHAGFRTPGALLAISTNITSRRIRLEVIIACSDPTPSDYDHEPRQPTLVLHKGRLEDCLNTQQETVTCSPRVTCDELDMLMYAGVPWESG